MLTTVAGTGLECSGPHLGTERTQEGVGLQRAYRSEDLSLFLSGIVMAIVVTIMSIPQKVQSKPLKEALDAVESRV